MFNSMFDELKHSHKKQAMAMTMVKRSKAL